MFPRRGNRSGLRKEASGGWQPFAREKPVTRPNGSPHARAAATAATPADGLHRPHRDHLRAQPYPALLVAHHAVSAGRRPERAFPAFNWRSRSGVTQKSAWFMLQRLRKPAAMTLLSCAGSSKSTEMYVGGKEANKAQRQEAQRWAWRGRQRLPCWDARARRRDEAPCGGEDATWRLCITKVHQHVAAGSTLHTEGHWRLPMALAGCSSTTKRSTTVKGEYVPRRRDHQRR